MIDPQKFWSSNYYNNPPLSDEMIRMAESELSVKLPGAYLDLLRIQNGGYTYGFVYKTAEPTRVAKDHIMLESLAGIIPEPPSQISQNILATQHLVKEWGLPDRQVLISGEGHWWITLDYRNGEIPTVMWLDVEFDQELQLAQTFDEFLKGLIPEVDFNFDES